MNCKEFLKKWKERQKERELRRAVEILVRNAKPGTIAHIIREEQKRSWDESH